MDAEQFLAIIRNDVQKLIPDSPFVLGTIPADYVSGRPRIQFDGESSASTKTYPYLSSYTPAANDRVLLGQAGHGWVVLGEVT